MKNSTLLYLLLLAPSLALAQQQPVVSIVPEPVQLQLGQGGFTIDGGTTVRLDNARRELAPAADFLAGCIQRISGYELPRKGKASNAIRLSLENVPGVGEEGYKLAVSPQGIRISANTKAGILYGMQSLLQTLPQVRTNAALLVPSMQVTDYPRFAWRGMHLDVSRHFFPPAAVKEYIDLLASYKMNRFHWHLIDDTGWRLQIKQYPKLTEVGAWRVDQNDKAWDQRPQAQPGQAPTYGGYYTQQQVREIVAYAAARNVTVVPEIEMPGHVASAIAAYPELSCEQKPQLPLTGGNYTGISSNYCPGNEAVYTFLENVLDETMALFPGKYIHIGGDEVDKSSWKKCARCQALMKREGLKDEDELQSYFIKRIEKYVVSKGRRIIGWDEILEGGLAPEATVMSWRGESGGIEAARQGHDVVMTPGKPVYFDQYQAGPAGEPLAIGGFNTLKNVYDYEPVPKELTAAQAQHVLGAQANLWTEYITTVNQVEYMVLPRMLALAEVVWSPKEKRSWEGFSARLPYHYKGFGQRGLNYSPGNFTVAIQPIAQNGALAVALSAEVVGAPIYYTLDGSEPTGQSTAYRGPVPITSSVTLKAVTVVNGQVKGVVPAAQSFAVHKAIGRNVTYRNPISKYYQAEGPNSLTDGVRGTTAVGKHWHGLSGNDLVATVDLGAPQAVSNLTLGCLQNYRDWIFMPRQVKFEVSTDGTNFKEVGTVQNQVSVDEKDATIRDFTASFPTQQARYVRVTAKNLGANPKGHPGEGKAPWIFADEIIVK
ncbi:family 20 glycosylhydrolase (plasmid) [Hymenobacter sp. NBH84]|uniref:glycoside hydrolase family 20 protein n=1 Tax=Hymenobacter sp. NBH84 TaxID=2596915 RepID=UPI001625359D|nr:family 20 glycosylhydrolase [Hymenobacter sp. NBH84]QNE41965.1 family 20 glycosylhydrolase [Hymenobacter sp. NBH84]